MTTDRFTKQDTVRIDIRLYQTPICKYLPLNCIMYRDNSCRIFAVVTWWVWILRSSLEFDKQLIMSNELIQRMWTSQQAATLLPMTLSARANVFHTHVLMTQPTKQRKKLPHMSLNCSGRHALYNRLLCITWISVTHGVTHENSKQVTQVDASPNNVSLTSPRALCKPPVWANQVFYIKMTWSITSNEMCECIHRIMTPNWNFTVAHSMTSNDSKD